MRVLITGRSGSGKSTICKELKLHGYNSFDSDHVQGLADWIDPRTDNITNVDYTKPIDTAQAEWRWNRSVLTKLLETPGDIFLCGSADNELELHGLFNKVFVLTLPPETQRQRILSRTEHDYGKLPKMQEKILAEQTKFVADAINLGAKPIDASSSPTKIVASILAQIHAR